MATATKKELQQFDVVLTLSKEEAQTLLDVMRKIGGSPEYSRRRYTDSIAKALTDVGLNVGLPEDLISGSFWFKDPANNDLHRY